jgi:hypothetical protein
MEQIVPAVRCITVGRRANLVQLKYKISAAARIDVSGGENSRTVAWRNCTVPLMLLTVPCPPRVAPPATVTLEELAMLPSIKGARIHGIAPV